MKTILELENWIVENNRKKIYLPNNSYNKYVTDIGEGLEEIYGLFTFYFIDEKGNRYDDKFFRDEKEAVQYVFEYSKNEK